MLFLCYLVLHYFLYIGRNLYENNFYYEQICIWKYNLDYIVWFRFHSRHRLRLHDWLLDTTLILYLLLSFLAIRQIQLRWSVVPSPTSASDESLSVLNGHGFIYSAHVNIFFGPSWSSPIFSTLYLSGPFKLVTPYGKRNFPRSFRPATIESVWWQPCLPRCTRAPYSFCGWTALNKICGNWNYSFWAKNENVSWAPDIEGSSRIDGIIFVIILCISYENYHATAGKYIKI